MKRAPGSADEAFEWIEAFTNLERGGYHPREYRLERMSRLLEDFHNPHIGPATVHIAGSKGKGSTACFVEAGLRASGLRTGLYASPHVNDYRERFLINGHFAADEDILTEVLRIHAWVEPMRQLPDAAERLPTTFELLTLLAFLLFRRAACDWIVLETGLGGRLDATNLCRPDICLITPIELEHTEYLGDTLAAIAGEKAGIFKPGIPAIISAQHPEAEAVFLQTGDRRGVHVRRLSEEVRLEELHVDPAGTHATLILEDAHTNGPQHYELHVSLVGAVQAQNAALAFLALRTVLPDTDPEHFLLGFADASLPGRAELFPGSPALLLDGAHTRGSIRTLMDTVSTILPAPVVCLFGAVTGKDVNAMAEEIGNTAEAVVVSRPGTFKRSDPEAVAGVFRGRGMTTDLVPDPAMALARARARAGRDGSVVVTGSFFMVCEIRTILLEEHSK
ncbi:MAG: bifunctional folylpolyglutamate synthase/dihydrofolate synthase [Spirochaetota bacterium]